MKSLLIMFVVFLHCLLYADHLVVKIGPDENLSCVSTIFHLAGNKEYHSLNDAHFQQEFLDKFSDFKKHPAVIEAINLRNNHGIAYERVMGLGVNLESCDPFVLRHQGLYLKNWPSINEFAALLTQFYKDSNFKQFYTQNIKANPKITAYTRFLEKTNEHIPCVDWLERFFAPGDGVIRIIPTLFGQNCNASPVAEYCYIQISIDPRKNLDSLSAMQSISEIIVHEYVHTKTNQLVLITYNDLADLASHIYPTVKHHMKFQAYGKPQTMMAETFVRAVVAVYIFDTFEETRLKQYLTEQKNFGFILVEPFFYKILEERRAHGEDWTFDQSRKAYIDFFKSIDAKQLIDDFMVQQSLPANECKTPVQAISPETNAKNVSPYIEEIKISLDQPVKIQGFLSVWGELPEIRSTSFDEQSNILTAKVALKPETEYAIFFTFSSKNDKKIEFVPFVYTFTTGKL